MEKGFFVVFKRSRPLSANSTSWKSDLVEPIHGWCPVDGGTIDEAIEGQRLQYATRVQAGKGVPGLVWLKDSPMATGQMVRFVPIAAS